MMLKRACMSLPFLGLVAIKTALGDEGRQMQVTKVQTAARGLALPDLPWDNLKAKLNPSTVLLDTIPASAYTEECLPIIESGIAIPTAWGAHYLLKNQTSGLCMINVLCGLENCGFEANDEKETANKKVLAALSLLQGDLSMFDPSNNPSFNLPSKVLLPQVAGDVAAAINFAKEHSMEVSIKNSGHSFTGASTKKATLHLNMRSYEQYSSTGFVDCSDQQDAVMEQDLSNQPCKLALARNKPAVLHVGGGENWDQVYHSVKAFNEQQDSYKYHIVGGAAGSVSPMGWTWQGGLSGTTAGRLHGFGADQVLQIEMILPGGLHVRFGPVSWEDEEGFVYPRTTNVSGVCNEKEDNSVGTWGPCQDDVNFDDLWFATRGGLGGSWGVVLSVQLQLHHYEPFEYVMGGTCEQAFASPAAKDIYFRFLIDFLLDPIVVGLSQDESNRCGAPTSIFNLWCYGNGAGDAFITAWTAYIADRNQTLHQDGGLSYENITAYAGCFTVERQFKDIADLAAIPDGPYKGRVADDAINPLGYMSLQNIIVPKKWILENKDKAVSLMSGNYDAWASMGLGSSALYLAFGGASTSDQANALSDAHREGGFMLMSLFNLDLTLTAVATAAGFNLGPTGPDAGSFYSELLPEMYESTDSNNFHGYYGSNHAGQVSLGPLKSDWTKPCPLDWTQKEREEKCMSLQEAIFGTERLARLEAIKKAIDPNSMFDCNRCVLNNRATAGESTDSRAGGVDDEDAATPTGDSDSEVKDAAPPSEDSGCQGLSAMMTSTAWLWALVGWMAF